MLTKQTADILREMIRGRKVSVPGKKLPVIPPRGLKWPIPFVVFVVTLSQDGGTYYSSSTGRATWTYTVTDNQTAATLAEDASPDFRYPGYADAASEGLAYYDDDDVFHLIQANESIRAVHLVL